MTRNRYRTPTTPPVSAWARHLDAYARIEGLSVSGLFRLLRKAVALGPESRTAFRPYLVDKEPDADQAKALAAIIGWPPVEAQPVAKSDEPQPDLLSAIATLVKALDADREERLALTRAIAALAQSLATTPEVGELLAQLALRKTAG